MYLNVTILVTALLVLVSGPHCGGGAGRRLYRDSRHQIQNTGYSGYRGCSGYR